MRIKLLGKHWKIKFEALGRYRADGKKVDGLCSDPNEKDKTIWIDSRLKGEEELDTLIHEMLHACDLWRTCEEHVTQQASDMARALWRLGYRRKSKEQT